MGILRRIIDRLDPAEETRAEEPSWTALRGLGHGGGPINPHLAENLATVFACVQGISSAIASLPAYVFRRGDGGRDIDPAHPVSDLIREGWNGQASWPDGLEFLLSQTLLRGNGLAEIERDTAGRVQALKPIPWEHVSVQVLPSGRLVYDVSPITATTGSTGAIRRLLDSEVLHLRDRSDDGLIGRSRLSRAAGAFEAGAAVQDFSNASFHNAVRPTGVLHTDQKLSDQAMDNIRSSFTDAFSGVSNAGRAIVLDHGLKWASMSMTLEDAELLATRRFTTEELARIFQVPPPLVGIWDHSSFTNAETAGRWFAQHTLTPWIRKLEEAFRRQVFTAQTRATHELEIDLSGFLRGDPAARWSGYAIAAQHGILSINEIREAEGWNPRADGDGLGTVNTDGAPT